LYPEIDVTVDVLSDISGTHPDERLTDRTKCVLHYSSAHGVLMGRGNVTVALALGKYLEDGDGVFPGSEEWVDSVFKAKLVPALPMLVLGFGALKSESSFDIFVKSVEVSAEDIVLLSGQSFHGKVCGNLDSNKASIWQSVSAPERDEISTMKLTSLGM
jgi:hypothetical protein